MTTMQMFQIVGGLCIFLYGISQATRNLQKLAGPMLRLLVARLTKHPIRGFVMGIMLAFSLQSSGAVVVMMINFANAGLISIAQALPIVFGAGIGSSMTVQLLAFKLQKYAPIIITFGFTMFYFLRPRIPHYIGRVIFCFGLIFLGMLIIKDGIAPFANDPAIAVMVNFFAGAPFWVAMLGFALAALFQSAAAVLGVLLILAFSGIVDLHIALPVIIGANVGACMLGAISGIGGKTEAKRIVVGQVISRVSLAIILFSLIGVYESFINLLGGETPRQIANAHMFFEISVGVLFLPVTKPIAWFLKKLLKSKTSEDDYAPKYLDPTSVGTPLIAVGQASKEILRMGELVEEMFSDWGKIFFANDKQLLQLLVAQDDKVDSLQVATTNYLSRISTEELSGELQKDVSSLSVALVSITFELEHIGDVLSKDLAVHTRKKIEVGYYFSDEGFAEIMKYHEEVMKNLHTVLNAIPLRDKTLARMVIEETKRLVERQRELYRSHICRLQKGLKESEETSAIHIDILSDLNKINLHISYIAYAIMGKV